MFRNLLLSCLLFVWAGLSLEASTSQWSSLGMAMTGKAAVAANPDGRLEVFVRGADNALWHAAQTAPGSSTWSSPQSLGGAMASDPVAVANADGRLEVFAVGTDRALWHAAQTSPGGAWGGLSSLGGTVAGNPSAGVNADGRVEVFVGGSGSTAVMHIWQTGPGANWSAWDTIAAEMAGSPAVARNADGRLMILTNDDEHKFWYMLQTAPSAATWYGWECLFGDAMNDPVVATNADGRLEAFSRHADNSIWHATQTGPGADGWSGWSSLGGAATSDMAVAANQDGRLEMFARGPDNSMMHAAQTAPGGNWSSWSSLSGNLAGTATAVRNSDGRLEVFAPGGDNNLWHIAQSAPGAFTMSPGQAPLISSTPVVNGASFVQGQPVAPGSFVAIFGSNFGSGMTLANFNSLPLATNLAGATVSFNGVQAAIIGVTGTQINAQVPWEALPAGAQTGQAQLVVTTSAGASAPATVQLTSAAPGLFSIFTDSTGVARPAAYINADANLPWPSSVGFAGYQTRPVKPNEVLILFATGLGVVNNQPADGGPGLVQAPYSTTPTNPVVLVGGVPAQVIFSGLSPQYPSLYQVAVIVPQGAPAGDAVPLQIQMNAITTTDQLKIAVAR